MRYLPKSGLIPLPLRSLQPPSSPADIRHALYSDPDVKKQLKEEQHSLCIYCGCRLNGDFGHIEHYRPQRGYTTEDSPSLHQPGYYWLAYDWQNLLLSCARCNTSCKQNSFALENEDERDIAGRDISREKPLLINPALEDPSAHMEFHEHITAPKFIDRFLSIRAIHTISLLRLNERADLVRNRRDMWERYEKWREVHALASAMIEMGKAVDHATRLLELAKSEIARMRDAAGEYSAMFLTC